MFLKNIRELYLTGSRNKLSFINLLPENLNGRRKRVKVAPCNEFRKKYIKHYNNQTKTLF